MDKYFHLKAIPSRKCEISDFNIFTLVKEGKFNREYLASCDGDKQPQIYKIKFMPKQVRYGSETIDPIRKFKTEKMVLEMATSYSFLMGLHASYSLPFGYILVTKDIGRRNLSDYIKGKSISNGRIAFYAAEIILAINFLHRNDIVHRNICPNNILLDDGHIKLSNFATCKKLGKGKRTKSICGTPLYRAPEMIGSQNYDFSVDWWSFGIILYQLIVRKNPYIEVIDANIDSKYLINRAPYIPLQLSSATSTILSGFLKKNPRERLGCDPGNYPWDIMFHSYFKDINWEMLEQRKIKPPHKRKRK
ncbi:unnamed protein product [Gordionus sp. m RMFG-2023]|uniref:protein kinase C zeta type-like n=1 Tax=Gordionus sp. m RMFG-2023 TaxID=3053472 RepID=UPI0030E5855D